VAGEGRGGRRRLGAVVTGTAAAFVLVACGGTGEGTVVAKADQADYDYACQAGGSVTGPVAVPAWGRAPIPSAGGWSSATMTAPGPSPA
jgi:hypothetical protein